ncbi:MAG: hypothetical protein ACRDAX_05215 [Propionibacteriaceae bacterium]
MANAGIAALFTCLCVEASNSISAWITHGVDIDHGQALAFIAAQQ